jgi:hypothetical protein
MYFAEFASQGGFGKFAMFRYLPLENTGVRPNRDTLYSLAVFDLDAGPVTITMPDAGGRFMSLLVIDKDHHAREVAYGAGARTYTKEQIGTRYLFAAVRILVNPADPQDFKQVHALQDAVKVTQPGGPGRCSDPEPASPANPAAVRRVLRTRRAVKRVREVSRRAQCVRAMSVH